eukprot:CAMPEP_0176410228 /NCGR_PEP_ID=MMETSP0127-20121128/2943_1 /TAXON_ID=938130 /ORGANISM="Platyophrya macrostoma, Strain WH" /LENGTH=285 /DNA_ID=CAMNT_0017789707 /DNA_START=93 /DNA_END=946 /DNA_ORIENTATION=-
MAATPSHQWNTSSSMKTVLTFPNGKTPRSPAARITPPASNQEARNPVNKSVAVPTSAPSVLTRKRKTDQSYASNDVFGPATVQREPPQASRSKNHTDPFDGSRQAAPRNLYTTYGAYPRSQPHPTGMKHCHPIESPQRHQFLSASGAISNGGRRHTTSPSHELNSASEPQAAGSRPKSPGGRRCLSPGAPNPITDVGSNALRPQPISPSRKRSPTRDQPTLVGVLYREGTPEPQGFVSRAPWHLDTPRQAPSQESVHILRPWDKFDSSRRSVSGANSASSPTAAA